MQDIYTERRKLVFCSQTCIRVLAWPLTGCAAPCEIILQLNEIVQGQVLGAELLLF